MTFDVTSAIGSGETLTQSAWVFLPERPAEAPAALVCLPGGLYDKHYWHLEIDGHPGYSFAEHLAAAGYIVVAVDHLAVGESTNPIASGPVGLDFLARGDADVVRQVRDKLRDGDLIDEVPPLTVPMVGVGHSMGSCLTTIVQANSGVYDAIALLGYSVEITHVYEGEATSTDMEERVQHSIVKLAEICGVSPTESHLMGNRAYLEELFYAGEVPQQVVDADTAVATRVPTRAGGEVNTPGFLAPFAPQVNVPVFLAFGAAIDVSPNPYAEPGNYSSAPEVTLYLVPKSGHCHNYASHRVSLWDRIASWIPTVV